MYIELNKRQIESFKEKYLSKFNEDIKKVSRITYRLTKEYLVNDHYFVIVRPFKVEYKEIYKLN